MDAMGNAPLSKERQILHGATDVRSSSVAGQGPRCAGHVRGANSAGVFS
jgi:hypothetical protein